MRQDIRGSLVVIFAIFLYTLPIMFGIFSKEIKDKKRMLFVYCSAGIFMLWIYVAMYPSIQQSSAQVSDLMKILPPELTKAFGIDSKSFTTLEGLLAGKHFSLIWPFLIIALGASFSGSFFSSQVEDSTIWFLLSSPVSRAKIYIGKFVAGIFGIFVFVFVSVMSIFPMARLSGVDIAGENYLKIALIGLFFGLAVYGLSLLFSVLFDEKGRATMMSIGVLLLMYVVNVAALLLESIDKIKYFSLFYYFDYTAILVHGRIMMSSFWVYGTFFVLTSCVALLSFNGKDIDG